MSDDDITPSLTEAEALEVADTIVAERPQRTGPLPDGPAAEPAIGNALRALNRAAMHVEAAHKHGRGAAADDWRWCGNAKAEIERAEFALKEAGNLLGVAARGRL